MSRPLIVGLAVSLLAVAACEPTTAPAAACSSDCFPTHYRHSVFTVHVSNAEGAAVSGASVRVEQPAGGGAGFFWNATSDAQGFAVFSFIERRYPKPINVRVTPPVGLPLDTAAISDTLVWDERAAFRVVPIVLPPRAAE